MSQETYLRYLQSPAWQATRRAAIQRSNAQCQDCGAFRHLEVHHLTYARLGAEHASDLRVLCRSCHRRAHARHQASFSAALEHISRIVPRALERLGLTVTRGDAA
ncbi:MAG: HNH endonuclease [Vicinamibacterales bacterium]